MLKNNLLFTKYTNFADCLYEFRLFIWILIYGESFSNLYLHTLIHIQTKINAYKDFRAFTCISMIKTCVFKKWKRKLSSCYFHKSRLIFNVTCYRHTTQKSIHTKINAYSNENEFICCLYACLLKTIPWWNATFIIPFFSF